MGSIRRSYLISAAVITILIIPVIIFAAGERPVGAVVAWKGEVKLSHGSGTQVSSIRQSQAIYVNDVITTSERSMAKLLMKDDSILSIGPNTKLKVSQFYLNSGKKKRVSVFKMLRGSVRTLAARYFGGTGSSFNIQTPTAVVGVKGTDFIIKTDRNSTEIITLHGEVLAKNAAKGVKGVVSIKPGQTSRVNKGEAPSKPTPTDPGRERELVELTSIPVTTTMEDMEGGCYSCHEKVVSLAKTAKVQHSIAVKDCNKCHIKDGEKYESIKVEGDSRSSIYPLKLEAGLDYSVKIKARDKKGVEGVSKKILFNTSKMKRYRQDTASIPVVTNARVTRLDSAMFWTAVVEWETDRPTTSMVEYGLTHVYSNSAVSDKGFVTDHKVLIDQLYKNKTYNIRVVSKDINGNIIMSEPFKLKIKKPFVIEEQEDARVPQFESVEVVTVNNEPAVKWKLNKNASVTIEIEKRFSKSEAKKRDPHSPGLKFMDEAGIDLCLECHKGEVHKATSHPTGLVNWGRVSSLHGLPVGEKRDLLCATCHNPHGSGFNNILRDNDEELCSKCHSGDRRR
ncbi:MAG: FecR domain-containing protein [Deltaproteobacteria bacterium]|nr:FecR domain-containing protein [Deltaproteobacteria bacterium]